MVLVVGGALIVLSFAFCDVGSRRAINEPLWDPVPGVCVCVRERERERESMWLSTLP